VGSVSETQGAVKIHALLDFRGNIPTVVIVTHGKIHKVNILDQIIIEAGTIYIVDRGYTDFARLYAMHQSSAFFITRAKNHFRYRRLYSQKIDKITDIHCDQIIVLKNFYVSKDYPAKLRRICYLDKVSNQRLVFLTNNFILPALTIAEPYRCRWQIELFFKWIKQHLRIKAFYGTTENAVKTQIWIAISMYVLVAIVKKTLNLDRSLYTILQILSVTLFEKTPILQALSSINCKKQEAWRQRHLNKKYYSESTYKEYLKEWRVKNADKVTAYEKRRWKELKASPAYPVFKERKKNYMRGWRAKRTNYPKMNLN
jgi:hypothetical protein